MPMLADYKVLLLKEVGAGLEGQPDEVVAAVLDVVTPMLDTVWDMNHQHGLVWPRLQYLYVKRTCLDILMGQNRDRITISVGGSSVPQQMIVDNLSKMRVLVVEEIKLTEERAGASRPPAMAPMASDTHMDQYGRLYNPLCPSVPFNRRIT